jgi:competence protein ComEA
VLHFLNKERIIFICLILISGISGYILGNIIFPKKAVCGVNTHIDKEKSVETKAQLCEVYVELSGAVNKPDVYCMEKTSLVIDVLKKAQGFSKTYAKRYVDRNINLAAQINSNSKIYIPFQDEIIKENTIFDLKKINEGGKGSSSCVSINTASLEQLDSLTGVGPSTAAKIIEGRPYKQLSDLKNVSGIGDTVFSNIEKQICL